MLIYELLILFALILVNAFFSMSEIAIISSRRARLQSEAQEGDKKAVVALKIVEEPHLMLSTVQVGITLIGVIASVYGGVTLSDNLSDLLGLIPGLASYSEIMAYVFVVLIITYVSVVVGELVPKRIAITYPETIAKAVSPLMNAVTRSFAPVVKFLDFSSAVVQKLFPLKIKEDDVVTEDEISFMISRGMESGVIEKTEENIVRKVFKLGDRPADSIMTPRKDLFWIDLNDPLDRIWSEVCQNDFSYFPLADGSVEKIAGIVSVKDLSVMIMDKTGESLTDIAKDPLKVPSNMTALRVLELFQSNKKQIALVIDEYGGVDGIITAHDLMEAIVGDLANSEDEEPLYTRRRDGAIVADAGMDLDDLFNLLELPGFEHEDHKGYHSLGGFILKQLGHIPSVGERLEFSGFSFVIIDMDKHRVDKVLIERQKTEPAAG